MAIATGAETPALEREFGRAAPGGAGADPERGPQVVEAAPGLELGLAQRAPQLVGVPRRAPALLQRGQERPVGLLDADPDRHPLGPGEHLAVDRALGADRRDDVVDHVRQLRANGGHRLRRKLLGTPDAGLHYQIVTKAPAASRCRDPEIHLRTQA